MIEADRKLRGGGISCTIYGCIHAWIHTCMHTFLGDVTYLLDVPRYIIYAVNTFQPWLETLV